MLAIRKAIPADHDTLARIFHVVRQRQFHWADRSVLQKDDFAAQIDGEDVYVAETDGAARGFISVWAPESFIHHLYVATDYQRRGIGIALLDHVLLKYPLPFRLKCSESNAAALRFYFKQGWCVVGNGVAEEGPYLLLQLDKSSEDG